MPFSSFNTPQEFEVLLGALNEEAATDKKLTALAESLINVEAAEA